MKLVGNGSQPAGVAQFAQMLAPHNSLSNYTLASQILSTATANT